MARNAGELSWGSPRSTAITTTAVASTESRCGGDHSTASRPKAVCHTASIGAAPAVVIPATTASARPGVASSARSERSRKKAPITQTARAMPTSAIEP